MNWPFGGRTYLDHAATTPLDRGVLRAMNHVYRRGYYNPGSLSREGVEAKKLREQARSSVATLLGARPSQIVFARGGTEANTLVIQGVVMRAKREQNIVPHIIVSAIEHPAVLETVRGLTDRGFATHSIVPVKSDGIVDTGELKKLLTPETLLVTIQYANNEIGTIQPIREIAKIIRDHRSTTGAVTLFHTDAIQAANYLDLSVDKLGVDFLSLSGSKIYGPKSSGCFYMKRRDTIDPILFGGGQEGGLVPGTEDVAYVVGFAEALSKARGFAEGESARQSKLRDFLISELTSISGVTLTGHPTERLPNNIHVLVDGIDSERLVLELDARGFATSSQSACSTDKEGGSHVLEAMNIDMRGRASLRITLGRATTERELVFFARLFKTAVPRLRLEQKIA